MEIDVDPTYDFTKIQNLRSQIFSHTRYQQLSPDLRMLLEGKHPNIKDKPLKMVEPKAFLESIILFLDQGKLPKTPMFISV